MSKWPTKGQNSFGKPGSGSRTVLCGIPMVTGFYCAECPWTAYICILSVKKDEIHLSISIYAITTFIICQMFIVQAHWSIPSQMTICNQAYFLPKTILTRHYYSILFSVMVLLLWCHLVLLWCHIVLLFDRNVTQVLLWYLTSWYDVTIVAPCPRL